MLLYRDEDVALERSLLSREHVRDKLFWINDANDWVLGNQVICRLPCDNLPPPLPLPATSAPLPRPVYYLVAPAGGAAESRLAPATRRCISRAAAASGFGASAEAGPSANAGSSTSADFQQPAYQLPPQLAQQYGSDNPYYSPYPTGAMLPSFDSMSIDEPRAYHVKDSVAIHERNVPGPRRSITCPVPELRGSRAREYNPARRPASILICLSGAGFPGRSGSHRGLVAAGHSPPPTWLVWRRFPSGI
ncbi:hypothetical protein RND81_06G089900 [Saponaria officinalis]|uniref:Uncharacterized protein n=1 Tax=Saponaria officinalis TaxID=3572 RepID=A0AAW1K7V2_SAPOF